MMFEKTNLKDYIHNRYSMDAAGLIMHDDKDKVTVDDEVEEYDDSE